MIRFLIVFLVILTLGMTLGYMLHDQLKPAVTFCKPIVAAQIAKLNK